MSIEHRFTISYGKMHVPVYRVYARALTGIRPIPESNFTGRENTLFAYEIDVEVSGNNFLPAYTEGDNSNVVATDSMKNFVLRQALAFEGATLEGFLEHLGRNFLGTYPQMEHLQLTARELPFAPVAIPKQGAQSGFLASNVLFSREHTSAAVAMLDFERNGERTVVTQHSCGCNGLELFKITGSAFTRFLRDEYTTLAERVDRPLFIHMDLAWKYIDPAALLATDLSTYVPAEQVRDIVQVVFHEFVSESIQHLVHEMGLRVLARFPQLAEISFSAQNRTRDLVVASDTVEKQKVYTDPFSAYGLIKLTVNNTQP